MNSISIKGGDRLLGNAVVSVFALLIPTAVVVPRALPVWLILTSLIAAVRLIRAGGPRAAAPVWNVDTAAIALLILFAAASVAWSPSPRAIPTVLEIGYVSLGALLIGRLLGLVSLDEARRIRAAFLLGLGGGALVWVFDVVFDHPVHHALYGIPPEWSLNTDNVGKRTADVMALIVWSSAALAPRRLRPLAIAAPLIFLGVVCMGGSRSALVGASLGAVVLAASLISPTATRRTMLVALLLGFAGAVPAASWVAGGIDRWGDGMLFSSASHRVEIWGHAAERVPDAPILGHGVDASRALGPRVGESSRFGPLTETLLPLHPHNTFLQVWLELGAVGALLVALIASRLLGAIGRLPPETASVAAALYASGALMANTAYGTWQAWWMSGYLASALVMLIAARLDRAAESGD